MISKNFSYMELFSFTNLGMRRKVFLNYLESCNRTLPKSQDIKNRKLFRLYMAFAMSVGCFRVCVIRLLIRTCYSSLLFCKQLHIHSKQIHLHFLVCVQTLNLLRCGVYIASPDYNGSM